VETLKAFTWGYHGWGNESRHFLRAADACEKSRGYVPPFFVDLRLSRSGRAENFRGNNFAKIAGADRYRWMPQLGNNHVASKQGPLIQIVDPVAAELLLDQIIEFHQRKQRIVMFCHCAKSWLRLDNGYPSCHRVEVATLLLAAAKARRLKLTVAEWPGSEPVSRQVQCDERQTKAFKTGASFIPVASVDDKLPPTAVLGWGSTINFLCAHQEWTLVTGPAIVRSGYWRHEVIGVSPEELLKRGYGPRSTGLQH
jgi:hypothetical protein